MRILVVDNDSQVHAVTVLVAKGKTMTLVNDPFSPFSCVWNEYGKCDEPTETFARPDAVATHLDGLAASMLTELPVTMKSPPLSVRNAIKQLLRGHTGDDLQS